MKTLAVLCLIAFLMLAHETAASIDVDYYRLSPAEREKVTKDQDTWDKFSTQLIKGHFEAMQNAISKLKLDGLSQKERLAKMADAMKKSQDPALFDMAKDWHVIAYLLTGDATMKEEHVPGAPLHNLIFGGLKASVNTGYGAVRYFDAKLVAETASALAATDRKAISVRFDPAAMKKLDLYTLPEPEEKQGLLEEIDALTAFFQKAAAAHQDVMMFMW